MGHADVSDTVGVDAVDVDEENEIDDEVDEMNINDEEFIFLMED